MVDLASGGGIMKAPGQRACKPEGKEGGASRRARKRERLGGASAKHAKQDLRTTEFVALG